MESYVGQKASKGSIDPHDMPGTVVIYDLKELLLSSLTSLGWYSASPFDEIEHPRTVQDGKRILLHCLLLQSVHQSARDDQRSHFMHSAYSEIELTRKLLHQ